MLKKEYKINIGQEPIMFEVNNWASRAESSVLVSQGDTKVLVTVALGGQTKKDYLPLKVDYIERYYAVGEILGGKYNKREGKPSTEATLSARVIDRSIRPFFDKNLSRDVHVVATILSLGDYDPDILAINGASLALHISSIPWAGPVGAIRIVKSEVNSIEKNPNYSNRSQNKFELLLSSPGSGKISMIETSADNLKESDFIEILKENQGGFDEIVNLFEKIREEIGKPKFAIETKIVVENWKNIFREEFEDFLNKNYERIQNLDFINEVKKQFSEKVDSENVDSFVENEIKHFVRNEILENGRRLDGRKIDEIRPIEVKAERLSNKIHGSALFFRGETHVLSVTTLGDLDDDALQIQGMEIHTKKHFLHYYNFPPYSVGEAGSLRSPGRREIGHGNLAEKALKRVLPSDDSFPYTIRVVSEVLASNGSSSMASTCAASMSLLNAGVPLKSNVAGIAIGLVENDNKKVLLTDIMGQEDFYGLMDFKVSGTREGICAIQLDIKNHGLKIDLIEEILEKARVGRLQILDIMDAEISKPNSLPDGVEKIQKIHIPVDKIGLLIGKAGVNIKKITGDTNTNIDVKRDGTVLIIGESMSIERAIFEIKEHLDLDKI